MKTFKLFAGAAALLAMGTLASCSSDEPIKNGDDVAKADETRYLTVQLTSPLEGSRAFEDGTTNESHVKRLDFIFYDVNGNPTANPQSFAETDLNADDFANGPFEGGNVTRIWTSVVPVELVQGQNLPSQVVCLVNAAADAINTLKTKTLSELRDEVRSYCTSYTGTEFLMSNSVYFGQDVLTGQANQRLCATPINANTQLFKSEKEAKDAITNASGENASQAALVNIYVERLAAKVGFSMASTAVQGYTLKNGDAEGDVTLTFVPQYWAMNATAKQTYVTKRYGLANDDGSVNFKPTFDEINNVIKWNWNDAANHRSYWACSPSYYKNEYPLVSDQVNDLEGRTTEGDESNKDSNYAVKYYSYNEVKAQSEVANLSKQAIAATNGAFTTGNTGDAATGFIYPHETTVTISKINDVENGNPAAAVAAAVLVGQYKVGEADAFSTFYVDRNTGTNGTFYGVEANAIKALYNRQFIVFADNNGQTPVSVDNFTIEHPKAAVRAHLANQNIAGRLVTLQLKAVPAPAAYYFNIESNTYEAITEANLNKVNAQLVSVGYMDMFNNGMAFFSIPIRHLAWNDNYLKEGQYDWANMGIGALGLVRNHVYSLTVNKVEGLGTGLRDPEQPIIPAKDAVNQYIAMRLNILAWNVVNSWNVDL